MEMVNDMIVWFMKRRLPRIQEFMAQPVETQERVFQELIATARYTEWGMKYNYSQVKTVQEFKEQVPVSTYERLFPYIERILKGEPNVLWPSPVEHFAKSSGTTNARSRSNSSGRMLVSERNWVGCWRIEA